MGGMAVGVGGLTVELKLNRKKGEKWIPTGGCNPLTTL